MAGLRVAYVMQNTGVDIQSSAGPAVLIKSTVIGLKEAGHQVSLISLNGRRVTGMDDVARPGNTWDIATGVSGWRAFQRAESLVRRLQTQFNLPYLALFDSFRFYQGCLRALGQYDLCHEYAGLLSPAAALACRRLKLPYVLTVDADLLLESAVMGRPLRGLRALLARWAARTSYRLADRIICVSEPARINLIEQWQVRPEQIQVVPNGVDPDRFFFDEERRLQIRNRLGLAKSAPVAMFVGSFQVWHGIEHLVDAFRRIVARLPAARLVLVGDGPTWATVEAQIDSLELRDSVRMTGMVPYDQVPALLTAADVVTLPYPPLPQEMWFSPLKLYEYMAAGKAIVASRAGQIEQVIEHERSGMLVEPGDVEALAEAVICLMLDPAYRTRLGHRARRQAVTQHSWRTQIARVTDAYMSVLNIDSTPKEN